MTGARESAATVLDSTPTCRGRVAIFLAKCQASGRNIDGAFRYKLNRSAYEDKELDAYQPRSGGTMVQID